MVLRIAGIHNHAIMNLSSRWMIVGVFAVLAFAGPVAWGRIFEYQLKDRLERQMRDGWVAAGQPGEASQLSRGSRLEGLGLELSRTDANRLFAADLLYNFWWLWALIVIGCSYGLFVIMGNLLPIASVKHSADTSLS